MTACTILSSSKFFLSRLFNLKIQTFNYPTINFSLFLNQTTYNSPQKRLQRRTQSLEAINLQCFHNHTAATKFTQNNPKKKKKNPNKIKIPVKNCWPRESRHPGPLVRGGGILSSLCCCSLLSSADLSHIIYIHCRDWVGHCLLLLRMATTKFLRKRHQGKLNLDPGFLMILIKKSKWKEVTELTQNDALNSLSIFIRKEAEETAVPLIL